MRKKTNTRLFTFRYLTALFVSLFVFLSLSLFFFGCAVEQQKEDKIKIGLVTDVGKIDDKTFNQFAYEGMQKAAEEFGLKTSFIETLQPTDYPKNIGSFIDDGYPFIITVGFMLGDATAQAARQHPEVSFAIVDYSYDPPIPNVLGLTFAEDQGGFLAGALAALMSESGIVGFVGGKEIPPVIRYRKGYEAGAAYVDPKIKIMGVYIDSFTDPARGKAAAESMTAESADVIFGAGGPTGSGGIKAAHEKNVYVIGVDQDEYYTTFQGGPAPYLLSSAMKRVDNAVYKAIKKFVEGNFEGGTFVGSAANGSVGLAPFHDAAPKIPAEVKAKLMEIREGLASGDIKTGVEL